MCHLRHFLQSYTDISTFFFFGGGGGGVHNNPSDRLQTGGILTFHFLNNGCVCMLYFALLYVSYLLNIKCWYAYHAFLVLIHYD